MKYHKVDSEDSYTWYIFNTQRNDTPSNRLWAARQILRDHYNKFGDPTYQDFIDNIESMEPVVFNEQKATKLEFINL